MGHDAYGLPVSTQTPASREAYDRAVQGAPFLGRSGLEMFRAVGAQDPALALRHAGVARVTGPGSSATSWCR
jgi:hypothetical protein